MHGDGDPRQESYASLLQVSQFLARIEIDYYPYIEATVEPIGTRKAKPMSFSQLYTTYYAMQLFCLGTWDCLDSTLRYCVAIAVGDQNGTLREFQPRVDVEEKEFLRFESRNSEMIPYKTRRRFVLVLFLIFCPGPT